MVVLLHVRVKGLGLAAKLELKITGDRAGCTVFRVSKFVVFNLLSRLLVLITSLRCIVRHLAYDTFGLLAVGIAHTNRAHSCWVQRLLLQSLISFTEVFKVGHFKHLGCRHAISLIVIQHFRYDFLDFGRGIRN